MSSSGLILILLVIQSVGRSQLASSLNSLATPKALKVGQARMRADFDAVLLASSHSLLHDLGCASMLATFELRFVTAIPVGRRRESRKRRSPGLQSVALQSLRLL